MTCSFSGCSNEAGERKLIGLVDGIEVEVPICDEHYEAVTRGVLDHVSIGESESIRPPVRIL